MTENQNPQSPAPQSIPTPDPPASQNPFTERGVKFSQRQWDLVSNAMSGYANMLEHEGTAQAKSSAAVLRGLLICTNQIVHSGSGLVGETLERYKKRFADAMRTKDPAQIAEEYTYLFAAAIRLEPDPSQYVAQMTVELIGQAQRFFSFQAAAEILLGDLGVGGQLKGIADDIEAGKWTPSAKELLDFMQSWVDSGLANAREGLEPWPQQVTGEEVAT